MGYSTIIDYMSRSRDNQIQMPHIYEAFLALTFYTNLPKASPAWQVRILESLYLMNLNLM